MSNKILGIASELIDKDKRFVLFASHGFYKSMDDRKYLERLFKCKLGYPLNLNNPHTFNEKIQWLKLNYRKPIMSDIVDKYKVKNIIANSIGEKYVIPSLGVWEKFADIDFDALPEQFVLKCTHDSGGLVVVKDKKSFDINKARRKIDKCLRNNYYYWGREWPYKDVKPQIIAERYMDELEEYKIFCFNGIPEIVLICKGEAHSNTRTNDYCDMNLERLPFTSLYQNSIGKLEIPTCYSEMIEIAKKLSSDYPLARVDLYISENKVYFGELTFFHNTGLCVFEPKCWDKKLGDMIKLPMS